ncbi:MAG: hypothetical protein K1060chlam2_00787 [Chlamydiae bacterium]|nr:hypothetical protein [Chlamydiota bacterium]
MNLAKITLRKLAAVVSKKFREHGLDCILVGGACVTIYSKNRYQSYDLDFVTYEDMKKIEGALNELGFNRQQRYFHHPDTPFFLEFVAPPVSIGSEPIDTYNFLGEIKLLTSTDCVKDRLASYYFWDDSQALDQAIMVCKSQKDIDFMELERWSKKERNQEKYNYFLAKYISSKK